MVYLELCEFLMLPIGNRDNRDNGDNSDSSITGRDLCQRQGEKAGTKVTPRLCANRKRIAVTRIHGRAGGPVSKFRFVSGRGSFRVFQFNNSRRGGETRRVWVVSLGLGVAPQIFGCTYDQFNRLKQKSYPDTSTVNYTSH